MKNFFLLAALLGINILSFAQTKNSTISPTSKPESPSTNLLSDRKEISKDKSVAAATGEYIMMDNTSSFTILPSGMQGNKAPSANHSGQNTIYGENVMTNIQSAAQYNVGVGKNSLRSLTTGLSNISVGSDALYSNTKASENVAVGDLALNANTTASKNIAIGSLALRSQAYSNTNTAYDLHNIAIGFASLYSNNPTSVAEGDRNLGIGNYALYRNSKGRANLALGFESQYSNTEGTQNVAVGNYALRANILGGFNIAIGTNALYSNTVSNNIAIGNAALYSNNIGTFNTAVGTAALYSNFNSFGTGAEYTNLSSNNTALGYLALRENTRGFKNTAIGSGALRNNVGNYIPNPEFPTEYGMENTAVGYNALYTNTQGFNNTAVGSNALYTLNSTGGQAFSNTALGTSAGISITTGSGNTAIGAGAGIYVQGGSNNTFLGNGANVPFGSPSLTNATAIGYLATVNASNKLRIGNTSVTVVEGPVAYTFPSDRRLKENIINTNIGLEFIKRLQSVSYNYIADNTKIRHDGFIAQDIETVMKDLNISFSGVKKSDDGMYSLAYSDFVMPLVNAVKEQQNIIEGQASKILKLEEKLHKMSDLEARLSLIESSLSTKKLNQETKTDK
jgi:trimeric autotransporter adhesin